MFFSIRIHITPYSISQPLHIAFDRYCKSILSIVVGSDLEKLDLQLLLNENSSQFEVCAVALDALFLGVMSPLAENLVDSLPDAQTKAEYAVAATYKQGMKVSLPSIVTVLQVALLVQHKICSSSEGS